MPCHCPPDLAPSNKRSRIEHSSQSSTTSDPKPPPVAACQKPLDVSTNSYDLYNDLIRRIHDIETAHNVRLKRIELDIQRLSHDTTALLESKMDWRKEKLLAQLEMLQTEVGCLQDVVRASHSDPGMASDFEFEESQVDDENSVYYDMSR